MGEGPIRVVVVDDHEIVRHGIEAVLAREADLAVVGTFASGEAALRCLVPLAPDVVVLDYRLERINGATICAEIVRRAPSTAVLMLTCHTEDEILHACLSAGARGFLYKGAEAGDLVHGVRAVARGESVLASDVVGRVIEWAAESRGAYRSWEALSPFEARLLSLVAGGLKNSEIGRWVGLSETSVKSHLRVAMRKLGVKERSQAVAIGVRLGVI